MNAARLVPALAALCLFTGSFESPVAARSINARHHHADRVHHVSEARRARAAERIARLPAVDRRGNGASYRSRPATSRSGISRWTRAAAAIALRVAQYGGPVHARLLPYFQQAGVAYPPSRLVLLGLKEERVMQIYARGEDGKWTFIREYPILAASGRLGPKLERGDRQVPEGFYRIENLNPNSRFHLALHVSYPNASDREHAREAGFSDPGGNIMIHGSHSSAGCLAMGDQTAEDLFVLAADTGRENIEVILSPVDFRVTDVPASEAKELPWLPERYDGLRSALRKLPLPDAAP